MNCLIVPNSLHDAIHAAIDAALAGRPCAADERSSIYQTVLEYFDRHGRLPDFTLKENQSNGDSNG